MLQPGSRDAHQQLDRGGHEKAGDSDDDFRPHALPALEAQVERQLAPRDAPQQGPHERQQQRPLHDFTRDQGPGVGLANQQHAGAHRERETEEEHDDGFEVHLARHAGFVELGLEALFTGPLNGDAQQHDAQDEEREGEQGAEEERADQGAIVLGQPEALGVGPVLAVGLGHERKPAVARGQPLARLGIEHWSWGGRCSRRRRVDRRLKRVELLQGRGIAGHIAPGDGFSHQLLEKLGSLGGALQLRDHDSQPHPLGAAHRQV